MMTVAHQVFDPSAHVHERFQRRFRAWLSGCDLDALTREHAKLQDQELFQERSRAERLLPGDELARLLGLLRGAAPPASTSSTRTGLVAPTGLAAGMSWPGSAGRGPTARSCWTRHRRSAPTQKPNTPFSWHASPTCGRPWRGTPNAGPDRQPMSGAEADLPAGTGAAAGADLPAGAALFGYASRFSIAAGQTISFHVSGENVDRVPGGPGPVAARI